MPNARNTISRPAAWEETRPKRATEGEKAAEIRGTRAWTQPLHLNGLLKDVNITRPQYILEKPNGLFQSTRRPFLVGHRT